MTLTYNWGICRAVCRLPGVHRFWVQAQLPQNQKPINKRTAKVLFLHKEMDQQIRTFRNPEISSVIHVNQWERTGKIGWLPANIQEILSTYQKNIEYQV